MTEDFSYQGLIDAYEGRAGLLSRCILFGLVEPEGDMSPAIQATLAQTMVDELREAFEAGSSMFVSRASRGFKWTLRDDVVPEFSIVYGAGVISFLNPLDERSVSLSETDEFVSFMKKFSEFFQ